MNGDLAARVEQACQDLLGARQPISIGQVAARSGIGRSTLHRHPELRALVEEHRQRGATPSPSPGSPSRSTSYAPGSKGCR
jgi:hypothetical protein